MTAHSELTLTALVEDYLGWYYDRHPVHAATLGSPAHQNTLGDFSATALTSVETEGTAWLRRFEATASGGLSVDDAVDRGLVIATLRGAAINAEWPLWRRDPSVYTGPIFSALFIPFLRGGAPEAELVAAARHKLAEVPAVLAACRANLDPELSAPLLVRRALEQARTGRSFLTESLPAMVADPTLRAQLAEAAEPAAEAFDAVVAFLTDFAERARGDWRLGEKGYSALLLDKELLGYDTAELHRRGLAAHAALETEMREVAQRVPGGSADWRAVMERLQDDYPPTLEAMRSEYAAETERARRFLIEHELVSFAEGERCEVVPSPAYQRPILSVASYMAPPPLTASRLGHFFVPFTPDDFTEEQVRQRLQTNARAQMPTIAVHEAYPGHHWHLSWAAANPRGLRKTFRTPYFSEGWALYVETLMREQGYFADPAHELGHLEARLFRAARIVVDTALHTGEMEIAEAEEFMATKASLTPGTAKGEVRRYCAWPTQAPSYLTGCLEIESIRADYLAAGRGSLRTFHDTIAGSGALPLGLARRVALEG
ncbi:DUF885 domain-containing protein [Actinoalloteichus hymeniacidonis]|uniref:DUF885 family protein n=1 Tax=Actinoalloteichus hymeniacidonis TaxID=340345 RepID=A0AAC9HPZ0_9PSEU|nr:DUF885 domain-containing protein [Actinoalloteichus hymeniacidonis]AOS63161.1 hypothetical protein TL08_11735 [Actinoalloteichus hymeniacidonis]MBB5908802.1 uncharacterized protein (DUF885 family) [Actinoalloteichus hymeniacidonis]